MMDIAHGGEARGRVHFFNIIIDRVYNMCGVSWTSSSRIGTLYNNICNTIFIIDPQIVVVREGSRFV